MSTSILSTPALLTSTAVTPRTRRLRSLVKVLWRSLETVGQLRAGRVLEDTAASVQHSRPELARELRAASNHLMAY